MQYRILGPTGVQVSTLGLTGVQVSTPVLGAMNFGRLGRTTQAR